MVRILVTTVGNDVMVEIARLFHQGFLGAGVACSLAPDQIPPASLAASERWLIVAPHEYVPLFLERRLPRHDVDAICRVSAVLNVEQPGSQWFEEAARIARRSRGAFDISVDGVTELRRRSIDAFHAPLGDAGPSAEPGPAGLRDLDVVFMGHSSPRREEFFARYADTFAELECQILFSDLSRPRRADTSGYLSGTGRDGLLGRSKILLNVHASERHYFETHRALLAARHGCLLVTEVSRNTSPFENDVNCVIAPLDDLATACRTFAASGAERLRLTSAARALVESSLTMAQTCRSMLSAPFFAAASAIADDSAAGADLDMQREALAARLAAGQHQRQLGAADWTAHHNDAYGRVPAPRISVVISLHNYAHFIVECLLSVLNAERAPGGIEVVLVDDGSSDGWFPLVEPIIHDAVAPILVISKDTNTGLADARNVGIQAARGKSVFILDADNRIYPSCIRQLDAALTREAQAAVYGTIQRFEDGTNAPLGLLSHLPWDRAGLVQQPYIDAMALFDREALVGLGAYSTDLLEYGWSGWEDYDLWLKLAQKRLPCRQLPQIVAGYRTHPSAMLQHTNRTTDRIARHFHVKFRSLVDEFPDLDSYFGFPIAAARSGPADARARMDLEARCLALAHELRAVRASRSWRLTAPLRLVQRLLMGR